ncbi:MAG: MotA/TolQ/ExbB proton channel family protein [Bacteroidales bacterium]|nr:MotA/TolQ/ExbB proton channel family protein [Bacteroidales bacterium]
MKKLFAFLAVFGMLTFGASTLYSQESIEAETEAVVEEAAVEEVLEAVPAVVTEQAAAPEQGGLHKQLKIKFVEGGVPWMMPVLIFLILGLAICIERIIYLNLSSINSKKLLQNLENALSEGGIEAAKEVCRNTRGPIASIFYQGLMRWDEGVDVVEKSIVSYGSVQMGLLEKGFTWISLFIALAPSMGFLGTVVGMIMAFDQIQIMGDISPAAVAGGIKVALITTVFGLIVAMILQVFFNYLINKVEGIVGDMEDSSISLLDILVKYNMKN